MDGNNHTFKRESLVFSKKDNGIYYYQPNGESGYLYYNIPSIGYPKASVDCVKNTELLPFPYDSIFVNRNKKIFVEYKGLHYFYNGAYYCNNDKIIKAGLRCGIFKLGSKTSFRPCRKRTFGASSELETSLEQKWINVPFADIKVINTLFDFNDLVLYSGSAKTNVNAYYYKDCNIFNDILHASIKGSDGMCKWVPFSDLSRAIDYKDPLVLYNKILELESLIKFFKNVEFPNHGQEKTDG